MEAALRPHGLGSTQWYVLHQLARDGPTLQRELLRSLQVERATLTVIVGVLVRKGLVEQVPDRTDQRKKLVRMTPRGEQLWRLLPDLGAPINETAFANISASDMEAAIRVLRTATERLDSFSSKGAPR